VHPVAGILRQGALNPVFQPIVELASGRILGHEALIRGPEASPWHAPDALFAAAAREDLTLDLEIACAEIIVREVGLRAVPGRVFLNMSAQALAHYADRAGALALCELADRYAIPASKLVLEVTEHERVGDIAGLRRIANALRAHGVSFALDDFGDGRSSLRLWAELEPDYVKIDKYFTRDIAEHPAKSQTFHALRQIAETFGSRLIAEGLEDERSLSVVRDLGVEFGQGFFLARPNAAAPSELSVAAQHAFTHREVAVLRRAASTRLRGLSVEQLVIAVTPVAAEMQCDQVLEIFQAAPQIQALAVVVEGRPVGLITRRSFIERLAQPFRRELYGRRPCNIFMDPAPRLIERTADGDEIMAVLTSEDQRYLTDGFIITDGGRYVGIGSGQQLVRTVSEHRVEAARHANPLTFLPGNIPISDHIERLLRGHRPFAASYFDLRNFKPFNDVYGYWRGDEMIRLLAAIVLESVDPQRDFVGHVGGDDFVVLFQSEDWQPRCESIIAQFNARAVSLYDGEAVDAGGIACEDRNGHQAFFPLSTLSVGAVWVRPGQFRRPEEVASAAAAAKRIAKHSVTGLYVQGDPLEPAYEFSIEPVQVSGIQAS
jgi:EAL domain-containing protein (putative c-di-GMP-specific phosphodiesterase class I)/GGDEF domain-containing protein